MTQGHSTVTLLTALSTLKKCPKWTLGSRDTLKTVNKSASYPGPGAYGVPPMPLERAPRATLGSGERDPQFTSMKKPGPTAYNPNPDSVKACAPAWKIGSEERKSMARRNSVPGPGKYAIPSALSRVTAPMTARRPDPTERRSLTPGPGRYDQKRELNGFGWKIGTSVRPNPGLRSITPGPGHYPAPTAIGKTHPLKSNAPAFSLRSRRDLPTGMKNMPGPGEHGLYTTFG